MDSPHPHRVEQLYSGTMLPDFKSLDHFDFHLRDDGIVTNRSNPYSTMDTNVVLREMEALKTLSVQLGRNVPVLLDITGLVKMNKSARNMVSNFMYKEFICAGALVARNDIAYLIGNFTLQSIFTTVPIKVFRDRDKAEVWLLDRMKK